MLMMLEISAPLYLQSADMQQAEKGKSQDIELWNMCGLCLQGYVRNLLGHPALISA